MATIKELGMYPQTLEKLRPCAVPLQTGVENPNFLAARRVIVSIRSFQSACEEEAPADEAVERLVDRGPDMFMDPAEERGARERALEDSVRQAEQKGVSTDGAHCLRDILAR
ncbi:unnamed protein product, partial [Sphacelaria rigidula]